MQNPTLEKINTLFTDLCNDYDFLYPTYPGLYNIWTNVQHNYSNPMYYISYAISALPAFEIWENSTTNFDSACKQYMKLSNYGLNGTYLGTLKACKLTSPFSKGYFEKLSDTIVNYFNLDLNETASTEKKAS